jgi:hypothetical protein
MTSQSPRIYTYKITFEEVPYYYYGVHKEKYSNQEYWGTPITHKWCWDFYTPKKQILEVFDYTDESWLEAQKIEKRIIRPFLNDNWCLNEGCGGKYSSKLSSKAGKIGGQKTYEMRVGVHGRTKEQMSIDGKKRGQKTYELGIGIHAQTPKERRELAKKAAAQKWLCLETGFITNAGNLTQYQRARNINTSKRVRLS